MDEHSPEHWLYRLSAEDWIAAARNELVRARNALVAKQYRQGVVTARRAAGMAWNAVLALDAEPDARYGRSYMEHLVAMKSDASVSEPLQLAARALTEAPMTLALIPLGPGDTALADHAARVLEEADRRVSHRKQMKIH